MAQRHWVSRNLFGLRHQQQACKPSSKLGEIWQDFCSLHSYRARIQGVTNYRELLVGLRCRENAVRSDLHLICNPQRSVRHMSKRLRLEVRDICDDRCQSVVSLPEVAETGLTSNACKACSCKAAHPNSQFHASSELLEQP